jgi:hypothetical protein
MKDYDVWYKGIIIGNVKANGLAQARRLAQKIYGNKVDVSAC